MRETTRSRMAGGEPINEGVGQILNRDDNQEERNATEISTVDGGNN